MSSVGPTAKETTDSGRRGVPAPDPGNAPPAPLKVLVCGSRSWNRPTVIGRRLAKLPQGSEIIHGAARGADEFAATYASALGIKAAAFPADWRGKGKRAGILRNLEMLDQKPDVVIAFWDGRSTGTKHTIDEAEQRGIAVEIFYEQGGTDWR